MAFSVADYKAMDWIKVKTLGVGSYGVVDLVRPINSVSDDQVLAVKYCLYKRSGSLQKELQLLREFAGCSKIVQCYGDMLRYEKGMLFYNLLLEYAPYGTLWDLIKKYGGNIPESDVKCYTKMLLEGIRCIHSKGYVHCDLKPDNILVFPSPPDQSGSDLTLKIADFGLVRRHGEEYYENIKIHGLPLCMPPEDIKFPGTPYYMPPEEKISPKLDIWSLGCTVLQMLTGRLPWGHVKNKMDLAINIRFSPSLPDKIPENLSKQGKDFLMKCFARDPNRRWGADKLLRHPFLVSDQTKSLDRLPSDQELEAVMCFPFLEELDAVTCLPSIGDFEAIMCLPSTEELEAIMF